MFADLAKLAVLTDRANPGPANTALVMISNDGPPTVLRPWKAASRRISARIGPSGGPCGSIGKGALACELLGSFDPYRGARR